MPISTRLLQVSQMVAVLMLSKVFTLNLSVKSQLLLMTSAIITLIMNVRIIYYYDATALGSNYAVNDQDYHWVVMLSLIHI